VSPESRQFGSACNVSWTALLDFASCANLTLTTIVYNGMDKTHVGDCRVEGAGFEFLGYRFEAGRRLVRKQSLMALRDKVRARTPRNRGGSIESVIASLNPTLKGWYAYFKQAHRFTFSSIDGFIRRRLRAMLRKQMHRPGQGRCLNNHKRWPNSFFADLGLFTMSAAHQSARQSRCGNN